MDPEQAERMVCALETIAARLSQFVDCQHRQRIHVQNLELSMANVAGELNLIRRDMVGGL